MQIAKNTAVSITYELQSKDGEVLEQAGEQVTYLHGGYEGIFPAVEEALEGKEPGYVCRVELEPDDGFGEYDAELVRSEPRELFPADVKVGMQFEGGSDESGESRVYSVTDIAEDKVIVDGNHPLAGKSLVFACTVLDVRKATKEELTHGHVHGAGGHHH
ncbi:MAG: peptidylprolyl isomerase [Betaproteobacteria bacterium]